MRVLIIGASGFIGKYLVRRLNETTICEIVGTFFSGAPQDERCSWHQVELTDTSGLEQVFRLAKPDVVVHLAAVADVNTAERHPGRATVVNVGGTSSITRLCVQHQAKLVFISTEYVFDGERGPYLEDDTPQPNTHYGQTKWDAEQLVSRISTPWSILRTSIVYGWPLAGHRNYVPVLIDRLRKGSSFESPTDVYRTPIYAEHLADGILELVAGNYPGIHHVAGPEVVSMYQFASAVAKEFHLDPYLIVPTLENAGMSVGPEVLANNETYAGPDRRGLDCTRTMKLIGLRQLNLAQGLAEMRAAGDESQPM